MSYLPQPADKAPHPYAEVRTTSPRQPRRAPNDFLDYNHGPDSYSPAQRQPAARRWSSPSDERSQGQQG